MWSNYTKFHSMSRCMRVCVPWKMEKHSTPDTITGHPNMERLEQKEKTKKCHRSGHSLNITFPAEPSYTPKLRHIENGKEWTKENEWNKNCYQKIYLFTHIHTHIFTGLRKSEFFLSTLAEKPIDPCFNCETQFMQMAVLQIIGHTQCEWNVIRREKNECVFFYYPNVFFFFSFRMRENIKPLWVNLTS